MAKFWLVARHEYVNTVRRRAFLLSTLGLPLLIVVIIAVTIFLAVGAVDDRPLGYVDQAGILADSPVAANEPGRVPISGFAGEAAAQAALEAGQIQAFYVLPTDYLARRQVMIYFWDDPPRDSARRDFDAFLRANLLAGQPAAVQQRLSQGVDLTIRSGDGQREINGANIVNLMLPFAAGLLFVFSTMTSIGYLLQAVTAEKEDRTVEVMATSMTPLQLMGGKAVGLMAVTMTQLLIWVPVIVIGLAIGARLVTDLRGVTIPWGFLGVVLLYFVPAYALIAGMMISVGGIVSEMSQGQQIAGMLNLLFFVPYFLFAAVFSDPNSPLMVALTLFPTTSFVTVTIRWGATAIPAWQLIAGWLILVASAAASVWVSSRIFRAGMLRYGQPLSLRNILAALQRNP